MAPTGRIQDSDHVKFLLSCVRHSTLEKIDFNMVAQECNLPTPGAAGKRYEGLLKANNIPLKSKRGDDFDISDRLYVAVAGPGNKRGGGTPTTKTSTVNPDADDDADGETPAKKRKRGTGGAAKKEGGAAKKGKKVKEEPVESEEVKEEGEDDVHESIEFGDDFDVDSAVA